MRNEIGRKGWFEHLDLPDHPCAIVLFFFFFLELYNLSTFHSDWTRLKEEVDRILACPYVQFYPYSNQDYFICISLSVRQEVLPHRQCLSGKNSGLCDPAYPVYNLEWHWIYAKPFEHQCTRFMVPDLTDLMSAYRVYL